MNDPTHFLDGHTTASVGTGLVTSVIGGLTLTQWQAVAGITASLVGVMATGLITLWRYREYKRRIGNEAEKD